MPAGPVRVWRERDGRLLRIRLARPKANIIDAEMIAALDAALSDAEVAGGAPALRGVLLDAEGAHFSFGASVQEHLPESVAGMLKALHALLLRMLAFPVPILAAIRGQCLGGGLELAAAAHLIFVAPEAKLGQPEITLGVFAPAASCLLPERVGRAAAEDLLLSGRSIDGREALRIGLASAVAEDPEAAALAYFDEHLAKRSASSLRRALAAARSGLVDRVRGQLAAVEQLYLQDLMRSHDAVEGLNAFLEKRPPRWEDR
ncbi:MAG TPA: cyclohexa-1,5-dienecarbonyl-CoA hydratase [Candidatus Binataceae bacterium]|nr:cyclohexa-1,5-dienecarbonyl-CoA hydratase [Candidatus Binataceae bacterium]